MARDLVRQDDVVDNLNRECFRLALEIGDDADKREWAMTMLLAARAIERIGDNAVDIGEQVAFVVTGLFREFEDASHPERLVAPRPRRTMRLRSGSSGNMRGSPRDALRRHRYRLQYDPRARRRAGGRAVEEGDGAAGLHADQQGARRRRGDPAREDRGSRRGRRHPGAAGARARRRDDPRRRHRRRARGDQRRAGGGGDRQGRRGRGRHPQRRGGGPALLHRRDQDARPPGRGHGRRRRRRRRLDRGDPRHASRRRQGGALLAGRLRRRSPTS